MLNMYRTCRICKTILFLFLQFLKSGYIDDLEYVELKYVHIV